MDIVSTEIMRNMENSNKNKYIFGVIFILIVLLMITIGFAYLRTDDSLTTQEVNDYHSVVYNGKKYNYNTSIVSILLLGIDTADGDYHLGQADVIELILLDRKNKKIQLVSIPRDTMTEIKIYDVAGNSLGWQEQHINLAFSYGQDKKSGSMYTMQAISNMLSGVPIIHYATMNIDMLKDVHDIVGEIIVEVPNDSLIQLNPSWKKGERVRINSSNVETFIRTRDTDKDFSNMERIQRQEAYQKSYFSQLKLMLQNDFEKTVSDLYKVSSSMTTNISYSDMKNFSEMILNFKFDGSEDYYTIEGQNKSGALHDEYIIDEDKLMTLLLQLFYTEGD